MADGSRPVDATTMQIRSTDRAENVRYRWPEHTVASIDFSHDGTRWAIGYRNGDLEVVDSRTLKQIHLLRGPAKDCLVRFSPDGSLLIAHHPEVGVLAAYDLKSGRKLWHHHQSPAWRSTAIAFAPDGKHLATGDSDQRIRVLELTTGKIVTTLTFPAAPKAKEAASPSRDELPENVRMRLGSPHLWYSAQLQAGFFVDDGKRLLLFTHNDEAPRLLDTATGQLVGRLDDLQQEKPHRHLVS